MAQGTVSGAVLAILSGLVALIGLIVNVLADRDNIFDMTTSVLFLIALILAWAGVFAFRQELSKSLDRSQKRATIADPKVH